MRTAHDIIQMFGSVEDDQKYTRLLELFTDDAIYCDPFAGPQRGLDAIAGFMGEMERRLPKMGVYFADWQTVAETTVGWSRWTMVVPVNGVDHAIAGQSVYRLRDGLVCYASDYVDSEAYAAIRPDVFPDHESAAREAKGTSAKGRAADAVRTFWGHDANSHLRSVTEIEGSFTLQDYAGDENVAWAQWTGEHAGGTFPGWSLHTIRDGEVSLDAVYYDVARARRQRPPHDPR